MRIGIVALLHESNTFVTEPAGWRHFEGHLLLEGTAIRESLSDSHHEIGGFFEGLDREGMEAVPIFAARAIPCGAIEPATYNQLRQRVVDGIQRAGRLDGILVAPHGAAVSGEIRDVDGDWLTCVRQLVGPDIPVVGTLDPHANLSPRMVAATTALIAYRSNPHLDQRARGVEAATLLARTLRGEVEPTQRAAFPPLAINIERQLTSELPCRALYKLADTQLRRSTVLSNSILLGFPYADVEEMGSAVLAVTDDAPDTAAECVEELAEYLWSHRKDFEGWLVDIDTALQRCTTLKGPICLLDMGDNVGGGSPGDGTHLLHAIRRHQVTPAFACLHDPEAVQRAVSAGAGGRVRMGVGGKTDERHGQPFDDDFTVVGLHDGKFLESEPRHGGFTECDQGPTAVVRNADGVTVMLTSRRMPPFSLRQLTSCHVNPASFHVLVAKGVHAPVAAYQPVCQRLIRVNTPGCTTADMVSLKYHHRRRPMYPFEKDTVWQVAAD
jgi:microcystin degradation protein MlrC